MKRIFYFISIFLLQNCLFADSTPGKTISKSIPINYKKTSVSYSLNGKVKKLSQNSLVLLEKLISSMQPNSTLKIKNTDFYGNKVLEIEYKSKLTLDLPGVRFIVTNYNSTVLKMFKCNDIKMNGFEATHRIATKQGCKGSVAWIWNCRNIEIKNANFNGCGSTGLSTHGSDGLVIIDSSFYNNSSKAVMLSKGKNKNKLESVKFLRCNFYNNKYHLYIGKGAFTPVSELLFEDCKFGKVLDGKNRIYNSDFFKNCSITTPFMKLK